MSKRAWEKEYEKYLNGDMDDEIQKLDDKLENKTITKEEYDELKKFKKIKANLYKVTNILELKEKLEAKVKPIKEEIDRLSVVEEANKEAEKIEKELTEIDKKREEVKEKLKDPNLEEKEKVELQSELGKLNLELTENNSKYLKNQEVFQKNKETKLKKSKGMSVEELEAQSFDIGEMVSKCNMAANNLMQGTSWDAIEVKLENWESKKYKANKKITKLARDAQKAKEEPIEDLEEKIVKTTQEQLEDDEELGLVEQSEFETKHPRLAKIANFIKEKWTNIKNRFSKEEIEEMEETTEMTETAETNKGTEREDFKEYLKKVAEKGLEQTGKEKLEQAKRQAYAREAEKFGKDYADKSYKPDEEER